MGLKDAPATCHKMMVLSALPVASHCPSLLKAIEIISPVCVSSVTSMRVVRSQILVLLCNPAAPKIPRGLKEIEKTGSELSSLNGCFSPDATSQNETRPLRPAVATNLLSLSNATPVTWPPWGRGNCVCASRLTRMPRLFRTFSLSYSTAATHFESGLIVVPYVRLSAVRMMLPLVPSLIWLICSAGMLQIL